MMGRSSLRGWLAQEIVQTTDATPPAALAWTCPICGPQPPVALAGNRWVRRRCRCEREHLAQEAAEEKRVKLAQARQEPGASIVSPRGGSMTQIGHALSWRKDPVGTPPAELIWSCPTCGPIQPFALPSGRWVRRSCACQRQVREAQERQERLQVWKDEQLQRTFGGWLGMQWVDQEWIAAMASKTFASYDLLRQPEAYELAFTFAKAPQGNLLFCGEAFGLGKTHLEAAICNYAREVGWPAPDGSVRPSGSLFVSAPQMFAAYHDTRKAYDQTAHLRLMNALTTSPLLVIDDVDKKTPRDGDWDVYWMLFEARYTARRPTILSTNKRAELQQYIGEAALSRFSYRLVPIEMRGADYRREEPWALT